MKTFKTEDAAIKCVLAHNAKLDWRNDMHVLVDGPGDAEFTVMPLREAIENDFLYRWVA